MKNDKPITIGCVSMTHLGLIHSVAFAAKAFNVVCYDDHVELIENLKIGQFPVSEPSLLELSVTHASHLSFTSDVQQLSLCDVVFIACDVPTDDQGQSDLQVIHELIEKVTPVLSDVATLVILSQVPPGFTRKIAYEKRQLFYQVETLVFGQAIARALYPERYIIGAAFADRPLPEAYLKLLESFNCPLLTMRYESAELAKISINMFLVSSVSTTNLLAEVCERIGADWEEIAPALRLDKRIGPFSYLAPGLGLSGGNLERDLNTVMTLGKAASTNTTVVEAWISQSRYYRDWVLRCLTENVLSSAEHPVICILGLAYKPDTHSLKNSPSVALINQLQGYQINVHDPIVKGYEAQHVTQYSALLDAIATADVVVIMTPWEAYQHELSVPLLQKHMRGKTIIDPFRVLQRKGVMLSEFKNMNYFSLGQSPMVALEEKELHHVEA